MPTRCISVGKGRSSKNAHKSKKLVHQPPLYARMKERGFEVKMEEDVVAGLIIIGWKEQQE